MQVSILAIYLVSLLAFEAKANRLPEVVMKNCASCHGYFSSTKDFENTRFITSSTGREIFEKSLDYMPPDKKLSKNEKIEILNWYQNVKDKFPLEKSRELTSKEVALRCYQTLYNGVQKSKLVSKINNISSTQESISYCKSLIQNIDVEVTNNLYKFFNSTYPSYNLSFNNQDWGSFEVYEMGQLALGLINTILKDKKLDTIFLGPLYSTKRERKFDDSYLLTRQYNKYFYPKKNLKYFYGTFEDTKSPMPPIKQVAKGNLVAIEQNLLGQKLDQRCFGNNLRKCEKTQVKLGKSFGAGVLGDPAYFLANNGLDIGEKPRGAFRNHRRWVNRIFSDYLCRKLPVVSSVNKKFIKKSSKLTFQRSKECMSCHITLDGLAKTTEHLAVYYNNIYAEKVDLLDEEDRNNDIVLQFSYPSAFKEAVTSELFYESLTSKKKYKKHLNDLDDFASFISNESDFYYCTASRLIEFVTGERVDILSLSKSEYRGIIESFKNHRRLKLLFSELLVHQNLQHF